MNPLAICLLALVGIVIISHPSVAQQPSSPVLPPPPPRAAWEISYKNEQSRKPAPQSQSALIVPSQTTAEIKSCDYTLDGELGKSVTRYNDGKSVTVYTMGSVGVGENPQDPKDLVITDFSSPWMAQGEFRKRYPGLDWVRPGIYKGVVEYRGAPCHYFVEGNAPQEASVAAPVEALVNPQAIHEQGRQAWFGMDGRPVAYMDRSSTATFTFKPEDSVPSIEVPERFFSVAQRYLDSLTPQLNH